MYERRLFRLLLSPSLLSGSLAVLAIVPYMAYAGWQYLQDNQYFYDFLFGAYGAKTYLWEHPFASPPWLSSFFSGSLAYFIGIIMIGLIVAATVYGILQMGAAMQVQKAELARDLTIAGTQHDVAIPEFITRIALRVMALLGWGLYTLFFASTILEAATLTLHSGIELVQGGHTAIGLLLIGADTVVLLIATHIHTYFLRLVVLRPRVAYGDRSIEMSKNGV